jgi:hypothetical protein
MKNNKNELDVDFIGGAGPLTKEEEKAISKFIKASKVRSGKKKARKSKTLSGRKANA